MEPRGLVPFYRWTPTSWVRKEGRGANYVSQGLLPDMAWGRWTEWSHVVSQECQSECILENVHVLCPSH